jgi:beta-phosphoglucomutase-like phosphatase (HAD superfamily)
MEAIAAIAATITTLIFDEALKECGKALGKSTSAKTAQLVTTIHQRFKESGKEGLLARAEEQTTESNIAIVEAELITQMSDDQAFVRQLEERLKDLGLASFTRQAMVSYIKANTIEVKGNLTQRASKASSANQVMGIELEVYRNVKFDGNLIKEN